MDLIVFVVVLVLLAVLALLFGADSRELDAVGPWHSWRDVAPARRSPVRPMADPADVEVEFRLGELRSIAARERLLRRPRFPRQPARRLRRVALTSVGASLVRVGRWLEGYGTQPSLIGQ